MEDEHRKDPSSGSHISQINYKTNDIPLSIAGVLAQEIQQDLPAQNVLKPVEAESSKDEASTADAGTVSSVETAATGADPSNEAAGVEPQSSPTPKKSIKSQRASKRVSCHFLVYCLGLTVRYFPFFRVPPAAGARGTLD